MIEGKSPSGGAPSATAHCDMAGCDVTEIVACAYQRGPRSGQAVPDAGQVHKKLSNQGWSFIKNKLRCPDCEAARKVVPMKSFEELEMPKDLREPTKTERREIMLMLSEVYDTDQERYRQGDTDDSVAEVLNVMPGWVSEIREDLFGPDGGNEDIESLELKIAEFRAEATKLLDEATKANQAVVRTLEQAKDFQSQLDKIKKAIGPRNVKKAGVA